MNNKSIIPIAIGIIIIIVGIVAITNQESNMIVTGNMTNKEPQSNDDDDDVLDKQIQGKLDKIKKMNDENEYFPKDREWITSGPFQIDRSEYILGEKIFLRVGELKVDEKGQIALLRPLNNTHYSVFITIPFDGSNKPTFNYYVEPQLSKIKEYCTVDDFIGDWRVVFRGTDYPNLEFKITEEILPGNESSFEPVC